MNNIYHYIKKYGDVTFKQKEFNEVDNLVFSLLPYLDFKNIVSRRRKYITLQKAGRKFLEKYTFKEVRQYGIAQREAYKLLKIVFNIDRYKNVLLYNYIYLSDRNTQFCTLSFKVKGKFIYISFEGTDHLLSGWKEDFQMSYEFPVPSQQHAIFYLNKNIKFWDKNVIIGGHSKGGNLAIASSMYCKESLLKKIKKIYSNDGPGFRKDQIESINYNRIKHKIIHIVPEYSVVGVLFRNDQYEVVCSSKRSILAHDMATWKIEDDHFMRGQLSHFSKNLEKSLIIWLDNHDDHQREKLVMDIFSNLEKSHIENLNDLRKIKKMIEIIHKMTKIDRETKKLLLNLLGFILKYLLLSSQRELDNTVLK